MSIKNLKIHREWSFMWGDVKWFINMHSGKVPNTYVLSVYTKLGDEPRTQQNSTTICSKYEPTVYKVFKSIRKYLPMAKDFFQGIRDTAGVLIVPFLDDPDKMKDLLILSKEDFLKSYSYLTEEEYDETLRIYHNILDAQAYALKHSGDNVVLDDEVYEELGRSE